MSKELPLAGEEVWCERRLRWYKFVCESNIADLWCIQKIGDGELLTPEQHAATKEQRLWHHQGDPRPEMDPLTDMAEGPRKSPWVQSAYDMANECGLRVIAANERHPRATPPDEDYPTPWWSFIKERLEKALAALDNAAEDCRDEQLDDKLHGLLQAAVEAVERAQEYLDKRTER